MRRLVTILIIIGCFVQTIQAQTPCYNALLEANKMHDGGLIQDAINLIKPCYVNKNLDNNERLEAARLLAICYIDIRNMEAAELYVRDMLDIEPDYQKLPNIDPKDLVLLLDKYEVVDVLNVGLRAGVNLNTVDVLKNYSLDDTPSTYYSRVGLKVGLILNYKLNRISSVVLAPQVSTINYQRDMANVAGSKKSYTEIITTAGFPIFYRHRMNLKNWQFHIDGGVQYDWIINSYADVQSTNLIDNVITQSSTKTTAFRNRSLYGVTWGRY
ncbi:MAG: hypothetical protein ACI8SE_001414 [Bacteroidia bacterium]|jgi:hypothetical protein